MLGLTVVGAGPRQKLVGNLARNLGLDRQVTFVGAAAPAGSQRSTTPTRSRSYPQLCAETFGLVALEAIACGCAVVGSLAGGLPEAIGPCGLTYPKTSIGGLASRLEQLMMEPRLFDQLRKYATEHLARHTRRAVAARYLSFANDSFPALARVQHRSSDALHSTGSAHG